MATKSSAEISIMEVKRTQMTFCILGTTPIIHNCMSAKARQEFLLPAPKKNAAEKAASVKHKPLEEFRDSPYKYRDVQDTLIYILPTAFKNAMMSAALDMPGVQKTQIKRLVYVHGQGISIFGVPEMFMAITRSADINKTPDVRTRAIMPEWACRLTVEFSPDLIKEKSIINLLSAGGIFSGVGDWRQQKGSGNYGSFKIVSEDDPDFVRITKTMGREAQIEALEKPKCFDIETEDLYAWYGSEADKRGLKVAA